METRELIKRFAAPGKFITVDCTDVFNDPEFDSPDHVFNLRYLPVALFERYQHASMQRLQKNDPRGLQVMLVAMALCDENGQAVFDYKKPDDMETVGRVPMKIISRLARAATKMNLDSEDEIKDNAGNLESGTTDDSF